MRQMLTCLGRRTVFESRLPVSPLARCPPGDQRAQPLASYLISQAGRTGLHGGNVDASFRSSSMVSAIGYLGQAEEQFPHEAVPDQDDSATAERSGQLCQESSKNRFEVNTDRVGKCAFSWDGRERPCGEGH